MKTIKEITIGLTDVMFNDMSSYFCLDSISECKHICLLEFAKRFDNIIKNEVKQDHDFINKELAKIQIIRQKQNG